MCARKSGRYRPRKRESRSRKPIFIVAFFAVIALIVVLLIMTGQNGSHEPTDRVLLRTNMGDITIQLHNDMPITTENFQKLVQQGIYDNTIFHRVIDGFVIQGGDPTGTGYGDPEIPSIPDEFTDHNRNNRGTVAMANAGPNTGSSQFFINLADNNDLDSLHPVFGEVIAGMDVVDNIGKVETGENDRPSQEVRLIKAEFVD